MVAGLLFLVSLVLLVLLLWGMIKPNKAFLGSDSTRQKVAKFYGVGFVACVIAFIIAVPKSEKPEAVSAAEPVKAAPAATAQAETKPVPPVKKGPEIPALESTFISIVAEAQQASKAAENDMQRGGVKSARDKKLCEAMTSLRATDWIGTVARVGANSDGKGVLEIEIARNITVKTWNNQLSDISSKTLIEPGTTLFDTASTFKEGQAIKFSGTFLKGPGGDCLNESSLSLAGKLRDPEFIFRFSDVTPL